MRRPVSSFILVLGLGASGWAAGADVVVRPAGGSGFVVKDASGANERLRVQDNGQISLPGVLVPGTQTQPQALCFGALGLLGPCSGGGGSYGAGAGLALSGSTFSVAPTYQLPQGCAADQIAQWSGSAWVCGAGGSGGVAGSGALNYLAKWTPDGATLGKSGVYDDGTYVGIGTTSPKNRLQVGALASPGLTEMDIAFGGAAAQSGLMQYLNVTQWVSTTDIMLLPNNLGQGPGNVGINGAPRNRLQVGGMTGSAFTDADIAFGKTKGSALYQNDAYMEIASDTNIGLLSQAGAGRVGINTVLPRAPLEVAGSTALSGYTYRNFGYFGDTGLCNPAPCPIPVSIYAAAGVMAAGFEAFSDARIKHIAQVSASARDLDTLNAIEVADYTMADKVTYGDKPFKKVIAQQVETVFPQVVSTHADFIPNVYQSSGRIEKAERGYKITFERAHHLSAKAKRIKLLAGESGAMQDHAIVAIPSDTEVVVDLPDAHAGRVFVYGEEVDDFRTVDYEGLTALNISATQELAKRLARQQAETAALMRAKDAQIVELQHVVAQLRANAADIAELKAALTAQGLAPLPPVVVAAARR